MNRLLPLAVALSLSTPALAADFSYNYIEGSFGEIGNEADGFYVGGAMDVAPQFAVIGALGLVDFGGGGADGDGTVLRGGALFHNELQKDLDLFGSLELVYVDYEIDTPFGDVGDDDVGFAAAGGVRFAVQDNFQLEGKLTLVEVDPFDDGLGLNVNARYFMNRQLSAAIGLADDAEFDGVYVNLRYDLK